jgi:hypothetical protein
MNSDWFISAPSLPDRLPQALKKGTAAAAPFCFEEHYGIQSLSVNTKSTE